MSVETVDGHLSLRARWTFRRLRRRLYLTLSLNRARSYAWGYRRHSPKGGKYPAWSIGFGWGAMTCVVGGA
jgi:hypothetical protein